MRRLLLICAAAALFAQDPPPNIKVDVRLVPVACSVSDKNGAPVPNLKREDFSLKDEGQKRDIQYFWQETDLPLTVGLIADVSGSQRGCIREHREALGQFLQQVLTPKDKAFIVAVASEPKLVTDVTGSMEDLRAGVESLELGARGGGTQLGEPCRGPGAPNQRRRHIIIRGCGGTALWNGVYAAAKLKMKPLTGRKAMIVLTDGLDTGSTHSLTDAIEAAQAADTLVYTLRCLGVMVKTSPILLLNVATNHKLERLSNETGGRAYHSEHEPAAIYSQIENELRTLYVLGFTPPENAKSGAFRKLQVKMNRSGLVVRARAGYAVP